MRRYESTAEVDAAIDADNGFCGYRTVGDLWIVVVDVPETAEAAQERIGGDVVELDGCS